MVTGVASVTELRSSPSAEAWPAQPARTTADRVRPARTAAAGRIVRGGVFCVVRLVVSFGFIMCSVDVEIPVATTVAPGGVNDLQSHFQGRQWPHLRDVRP